MNHPVEKLKEDIIQRTKEIRELAYSKFAMAEFPLDISFDLKGGTAGKAGMVNQRPTLKFNLAFADSNLPAFLSDTVIHEMAHIVEMRLHGESSHGYRWATIMYILGGIPTRCVQYEHSVQTNRRSRNNVYQCECGKVFHLTNVMHKSIEKRPRVHCKGRELKFLGIEFDKEI